MVLSGIRARSKWILAAALALSGATPAAPAPSTQPAVAFASSKELIRAMRQLTDEDPSVREAATIKLFSAGAEARPPILETLQRPSASPELKLRCSLILLHLPWDTTEDAPTAKNLLSAYKVEPQTLRVRVIGKLAEAHDAGGREALVRLLREEPSATVRWAIVAQVRQLHDEEFLHQLRAIEPANDAPQLVACGYSWVQRDPGRAMALFNRAVDVEWLNPTDDHPTNGDPNETRPLTTGGVVDDRGELDRVFDILYARAISTGAANNAAALLRQLAWRHLEPADDETGLPIPLLNLFALHAQYGPLEGYAQDTHAFASYLGEPEIIYAIGKMYQRQGQALASDACYRVASLASLGRQAGHKRVGEFLLRRGWYDLAEREYLAVLACNGPGKQIHDADAYVGLSRAAGGLGDDNQAAERLQKALDLARTLMNRAISNEPAFLAEIHWHELRAAMESNNNDLIDTKLTSLLGVRPVNSEMVLDVISALKRRGRLDEAAQLFQPLFTELKQLVDADPHNAELLNNLAWVCARCGVRAEQAVQWSTEAIETAPGNPAYLDTVAECNFVAGHARQAVRYESDALKHQPGDRFMMKQLRRFKAAAEK